MSVTSSASSSNSLGNLLRVRQNLSPLADQALAFVVDRLHAEVTHVYFNQVDVLLQKHLEYHRQAPRSGRAGVLVCEEPSTLALQLVHLEAEVHVCASSRKLFLDNLRVALGRVECLQS